MKDSTKSAVERATQALALANELLDEIDNEFWANLELPAACPDGQWGCCRDEDVVQIGWNHYSHGGLETTDDVRMDEAHAFIEDPAYFMMTRVFGYGPYWGMPNLGQMASPYYRSRSHHGPDAWWWNQGIWKRNDPDREDECQIERWGDDADDNYSAQFFGGGHIGSCLLDDCTNGVPEDPDHIGICDSCLDFLKAEVHDLSV